MNNSFQDTIIFQNINKNILKNKELNDFIQFKLDKTTFELKDLAEIKDIILNGKTINGDINIVDFNDIDFFPNLRKIELKNLDISKQYMKKLATLDEIHFNNCQIDSIEEIKNVKKLSINNSIISDFNQIENFQNLEELEIINMQILDFNFLKTLKKLQILKIKNIKEFSLNKINFLLTIKYLSIEGIKDLEEDFLIVNYPNLEILSIDLIKQAEWSEKLEKLMQKGIKILLNDIYVY